jgi:hypothetical protein
MSLGSAATSNILIIRPMLANMIEKFVIQDTGCGEDDDILAAGLES